MAIYKLRQKSVEAIQHVSPSQLVVVGKRGEQRANPGDFVIISGPTQFDREVVTAKDFFDQYELDQEATAAKRSGDGTDAGDWTEAGDGLGYPGDGVESGKTSVYGVPHFDSIEAAQQAAAGHYAPQTSFDGNGDVNNARPASTSPFECTIADDPRVYAIQPSGVVAQIPVAHSDPTIDLGAPGPAGAQSERFPHALAAAGGAVHDNPGPVSQFQTGTAAAESPLQTFGQTLDGTQQEVPEPVAEEGEEERQKEEGVTQEERMHDDQPE